ncbi:hypothetical protein C6P40_002961, partial [Pichia californica]
MGFFDKIKQKFHDDSHNKNRMMNTESNQQKYGMTEGEANVPRNNMMDTVSNEQGAKILGKENNSSLEYDTEGNNQNKNIMTHTLSNEQAEALSQGVDVAHDDSAPRNKLLDIIPNETVGNVSVEDSPKPNSD